MDWSELRSVAGQAEIGSLWEIFWTTQDVGTRVAGPGFQTLNRVTFGAHSSLIKERQMGRSLGVQIYATYKMENYSECPQFDIKHTPPVPVQADARLSDHI